MDKTAAALLDAMKQRASEMLEVLRGYVEAESPSRDKPALDRLGSLISTRFSSLDLHHERISNPLGGDHLRMTWNTEGQGSPALILCHFDTVWPLDTLATMPFRIDDGHAHGPGIYDMKASLVLVEFALRTLTELGLKPKRSLTMLFTSDEEIGSPTSRVLIEAEAKKSSHVMVMEPPLADGSLKTARKGVGRYDLEVEGRSAHAGVEPEKGINAIVELARQILDVEAFADVGAGTTVNIGMIEGGTAANVVPARASVAIDVRAVTLVEARRVERLFQELKPFHHECRIKVRGGFNRPPMERNPATATLYDRVRGIGRRLDLDLKEGSTGGGSDGNFSSAVGTPTIDGLGVPGAGAHAAHEHIEIDRIAGRAALLALLILEL